MKNYYLLGLISMMFLSCSKDDVSTEQSVASTEKEIKIIDFPSEVAMENKIDEIISLKSEKEKVAIANFASIEASKLIDKRSNTYDNIESQNNEILKSLKVYHQEELNNIYQLRKELNFTSIQSIADEINSLISVNPVKSKELTNKYKKFLIENEGQVRTIFDERTSNVINDNGEVSIKGEKVSSSNLTGRYVGDESVKWELAAGYDGIYVAFYYAGREVHKNDIGFKFFRYFTELKTFMASPNGRVACPSTFTVESGSIAGFVQNGSAPFSDYAFSYPFISGSGVSVRYSGGKKNTAYKPAGGQLAAKFSATVGGVYKEISCNLKYKE